MTDPITPPPLPPKKKNSGSLAWIPIVILCLVLVAGCIAGFLALIFGMMKSSDAYKEAVANAHADARVAEALGTPIKEAFFFTGSINVQAGSAGETGNASLVIPMSGPRGKGVLSAVARKSDGTWHYSVLSVAVENGEKIDLLPVATPGTSRSDPR